jgi:phosphomannomutase
MRFDPDGDRNVLVIEAPEGVVVRCLTREHNEN